MADPIAENTAICQEVGTTRLRFKVGDRVLANSKAGWEAGTVVQLHYREEAWAPERVAPYQIKLEGSCDCCERELIYAPYDDDDFITCIPSNPSEFPGLFEDRSCEEVRHCNGAGKSCPLHHHCENGIDCPKYHCCGAIGRLRMKLKQRQLKKKPQAMDIPPPSRGSNASQDVSLEELLAHIEGSDAASSSVKVKKKCRKRKKVKKKTTKCEKSIEDCPQKQPQEPPTTPPEVTKTRDCPEAHGCASTPPEKHVFAFPEDCCADEALATGCTATQISATDCPPVSFDAVLKKREAGRNAEIAELMSRLSALRAEKAADEELGRLWPGLSPKVACGGGTESISGTCTTAHCNCPDIAAAGREAIVAKLLEGVDFSAVFREEHFEDDIDPEERVALAAFSKGLKGAQD